MTIPFEHARTFLAELATHNDRAWFKAQRAQYERDVVQPLAALAEQLAPVMRRIDPQFETTPRPGKVLSRPYRDMRFARPGQGPLHEAAWCVWQNPLLKANAPPAYFFEISAFGIRYGMGYYSAPARRIQSIRAAIDRDPRRFGRLVADLNAVPDLVICGPTYVRSRASHLDEPLRAWYDRKSIHVEVESGPTLDFDALGSAMETLFLRLGPLYAFWRDAREEEIP